MSFQRRTAPLLVAVALGVALIALLTHSTETTAIVGDHRTPEVPPGSPPTLLSSDQRYAPAAQASMDPQQQSEAAPTLDVATIELDSSPHSVVWSGRLRTRTGGALPSWPVSLRSSSAVFEAQVARDGRFGWRLAPGRYAVSVPCHLAKFEVELPTPSGSGTGKSATEAVVPPGRDLDADIIVVAGRVSGRIVGAPYTGEDARLHLRRLGAPGPFTVVDEYVGRLYDAIEVGGTFGPLFLSPGEYHPTYVAWEVLGETWQLGSRHLLDVKGVPAVIHVLDGSEITGLELRYPSK